MKRFSRLMILGGLILAAAVGISAQPTSRLLTDATGIDDRSFNQAAWKGILDFYGDSWTKTSKRGKFYDVLTAQTQDMYIPNLMQASDEKYDLVIVTGFTWSDALIEVAPKYPKQKYLIVDVDWGGQPNVMEAVYAEHEGSYLVGVATALKAIEDKVANPKFGFIGGIPSPTITKFEVGFIQGVRSVLPKAEFVDYYANDWGKPELAKAQAKNWYDSGVYAIFSAAGGTGNGTIAQAKEYRVQGKNVWAIGVDSDQFQDGIYTGNKSAVLTSMLKRVETSTLVALKAVQAGTFKGGVVTFDTKNEGVGFSTSNPELSKAIVSKVEAVKKDIIAGKIAIVPTYAEAKAKGLVPSNLQASDN